MTHIIRFALGFLIGMSGSTAYHAFNDGYRKTGIALMIFGYILSLLTGVLLGMGRLD